MKAKLKVEEQSKKSFSWGITSTGIGFMHAKELHSAQDGCNCSNCDACGGCSVLPMTPPKEKTKRKTVNALSRGK